MKKGYPSLGQIYLFNFLGLDANLVFLETTDYSLFELYLVLALGLLHSLGTSGLAYNTLPDMRESQAPVIEAEADDYDSGLESASLASSTTSIASTIFKYRSENGRTYHAYKVI